MPTGPHENGHSNRHKKQAAHKGKPQGKGEQKVCA